MTLKKITSLAPGTNEVKDETKKVANVPQVNEKLKEFERQKEYFENLSKKVQARNIMMKHKEKILKLVNDPDLADALDSEHQNNQVGKIGLFLGDSRHSADYVIENDSLMFDVLRFILGKITNRIEEVELELLA
jgi:hypothetical protein